MYSFVADRWRYYRIFAVNALHCVGTYWGRRSIAWFVGRCLDYDGTWALYEGQDGELHFCLHPEKKTPARGYYGPDFEELHCLWWFSAPTREELLNRYHLYSNWVGEDDPEIPRALDVPVPEVEEMHRETGYDS
jgi:hypothetical protein